MILSTHGVIASQIQSFVGLLDLYPSAAAAYSIRKLRIAYTGNAIRVRRSSDNTETDIGFSGANLDTSSLTSFCGSGNGFVTTWYDQSGNGRNAIQTTAANQPQIVSSSAVININGKPSAKFDGSNDFLSYSGSTISAITKTTQIVVSQIAANNANTQFVFHFGQENANQSTGISYAASRKPTIFIWGSTETGVTSSVANQNLIFGINDNPTQSILVNNSISASSSVANTNIVNSTIALGSRVTTGLFFNGNMQEIILYYDSQSANQSGIQTNINTYYAIY